MVVYSLADSASTTRVRLLTYECPLWYSFIITVTTSISVFLPIILNTGLNFSTAASQCLVAPPVSASKTWRLVRITYATTVAPDPAVPPKPLRNREN